MSSTYRAIDWNRQKRRYDGTLAITLGLTLAVFGAISWRVAPHLTLETVVIRGSALAAFLLLHVILAIGPLARLDPRFLPLLYNRRHLGVTLFLLALLHATFAVIQFHALGNENPLVSVFTAYASDYRPVVAQRVNLAHLPFEPFGAAALLVFFLMAATSHDFWLRNLGPAAWKSLHLGVYLGYGLLLTHIAFGALQSERSPAFPALVFAGFLTLAGLHLAAARAETRSDTQIAPAADDGWVRVAAVGDLVDGRGKTVMVDGRRIALYRHRDRVFALSNVCRHQGGPLGEGRILDGCVTCPWHGWSYQPEDGCSPPPFTERIPTYPVRLSGDRILIRPEPLPTGTRSRGAAIGNPRSTASP